MSKRYIPQESDEAPLGKMLTQTAAGAVGCVVGVGAGTVTGFIRAEPIDSTPYVEPQETPERIAKDHVKELAAQTGWSEESIEQYEQAKREEINKRSEEKRATEKANLAAKDKRSDFIMGHLATGSAVGVALGVGVANAASAVHRRREREKAKKSQGTERD